MIEALLVTLPGALVNMRRFFNTPLIGEGVVARFLALGHAIGLDLLRREGACAMRARAFV